MESWKNLDFDYLGYKNLEKKTGIKRILQVKE